MTYQRHRHPPQLRRVGAVDGIEMADVSSVDITDVVAVDTTHVGRLEAH